MLAGRGKTILEPFSLTHVTQLSKAEPSALGEALQREFLNGGFGGIQVVTQGSIEHTKRVVARPTKGGIRTYSIRVPSWTDACG